MSLNDFKSAAVLIQAMEQGAQFVRITAGQRAGSVARVISVKSKYYSVHDYQLFITGRRNFWMKGSELEHLPDWKGGTSYQVNNETPKFNDLMGREIKVGQTIIFPRSADGAKMDMVIGTVKKIGEKGSIYAKLFKTGQDGHDMDNLVRVSKPSSSMILDNGTVDQVVLAKLSMF